MKPFPNRNDRGCDLDSLVLFGLRWKEGYHNFLCAVYLAGRERRDTYALMEHSTLHILLKPPSELSKHIRVYIINSNFSWILFVYSQPCITEVKFFFCNKHCHLTIKPVRESLWQRHKEREARGGRKLNTNCFQRRCKLNVCGTVFPHCRFLKFLQPQCSVIVIILKSVHIKHEGNCECLYLPQIVNVLTA